MENLQSLIAQLLGVAFAILGQLNDYLGHRRGNWVLAVNQAEIAEGGVERRRQTRNFFRFEYGPYSTLRMSRIGTVNPSTRAAG